MWAEKTGGLSRLTLMLEIQQVGGYLVLISTNTRGSLRQNPHALAESEWRRKEWGKTHTYAYKRLL